MGCGMGVGLPMTFSCTANMNCCYVADGWGCGSGAAMTFTCAANMNLLLCVHAFSLELHLAMGKPYRKPKKPLRQRAAEFLKAFADLLTNGLAQHLRYWDQASQMRLLDLQPVLWALRHRAGCLQPQAFHFRKWWNIRGYAIAPGRR